MHSVSHIPRVAGSGGIPASLDEVQRGVTQAVASGEKSAEKVAQGRRHFVRYLEEIV